MRKLLACAISLVLMLAMLMAVPSAFASEPTTFDPLGKYDEPITVNFSRAAQLDPKFAPGQDYDNNIWTQEYLDVLGIKINTVWMAEGMDAYREKLNMQILANDLPDIFVCEPQQFQILAEAGLIQPLQEVFDKYASDQVKEYFASDPYTLPMSSYDGQLMGMPQNNVGPGKFQYVWIREDWRKKLDLPVPKTMDDLYELAKAFSDPANNLNADGTKVYGLGISNQPFETYWSSVGFFHGYGAYPQMWVEKDGKLEYGGIQPEMKTALEALNRYFTEGLIDPEFIAKGSWNTYEDSLKGMNGIYFGEWWNVSWPLPDHMKLNQDWMGYAIPMTEESKGIGAELELRSVYVVRAGYEHPEALIKMFNLIEERVFTDQHDLDIYKGDGTYDYMMLAPIYTTLGPGNRNYRDHLEVTQAIDNNDISLCKNAESEQHYKHIMNYLANPGADVVAMGETEGTSVRDDYVTGMWKYKNFYGPDCIQALLQNWTDNGTFYMNKFFGANTETMATEWAQLKSDEEKMIVDIISGQQPSSAFDEFVESWKALGGDTITQEVNDWYASQK